MNHDEIFIHGINIIRQSQIFLTSIGDEFLDLVLKTLEYAKGIASILKEFKDYKVPNEAIVISNENYKIVQMKKNLEEYLTTPASEPLPPKAYTPKAKPQDKKHEDRPIPKREERREEPVDEKMNEDGNQLPPGLPPTPGGSTRSKGQELGKEKK